MSVAEVAELVDALGSGSSGGILVEVRVFSSAPKIQGSVNVLYYPQGPFLFPLSAFHPKKGSPRGEALLVFAALRFSDKTCGVYNFRLGIPSSIGRL